MFPLCADNGIQTLIYSPLARGRLARPWGATSIRSEAEPAAAQLYELTAAADEKIIGAIGAVAKERGVSQAVISLAWIYRNPVVAAPIVGALKASHIDDAIQAMSIKLTDEEATRLEAEYTPRVDPIVASSDPKGIAKAAASVGLNISVPAASK